MEFHTGRRVQNFRRGSIANKPKRSLAERMEIPEAENVSPRCDKEDFFGSKLRGKLVRKPLPALGGD